MQKEMINTDQFDADLTGMAKASIIFILVTLNIPIEQVGFLLGLVFVDSFFGVIREVKLKSPLSWERFIWGITSKLAIMLIPFVIATFGLVFKVHLAYLVQLFIYIIAANDVISVITNISSIRSGVKYKNVDFIEKGIHYLTATFTTMINNILKNNGKSE
jgi:hypothetical protein